MSKMSTIPSIDFVIGNENPSVGETTKSESVTNGRVIRNGGSTKSGGINFSTQVHKLRSV